MIEFERVIWSNPPHTQEGPSIAGCLGWAYLGVFFLVLPSMKMTPLDYLFILGLSHPCSSLLMFREDLPSYSFFHVHCLWTCHCAPLEVCPPCTLPSVLHWWDMPWVCSAPDSTVPTHPLLRSTVLRRSSERREYRTSKWWSVWAEAGTEVSGCTGEVCLSLK